MEQPDDFDTWSEACKARFARLKGIWDARMRAEAAFRTAELDAKAKKDTEDALKERQRREEAEFAEEGAWLSGYYRRRRELKARLKRDLRREYRDFVSQTPTPTQREQRDKQRALKRRRKQALDDLKNDRDRRRRRRTALRRSIRSRQREIDTAEGHTETARESETTAEDALETFESRDKLSERYWALVRACGPQDPKPGDEPVPITPRAFVPADGTQFLADDFLEQEGIELALFGDLDRDLPFVGSTDDIAFLDKTAETDDLPDLAKKPRRPKGEPAAAGRVWHEGCVEFLWVEGTAPTFTKKHHSNPITRTVARAAKEVNDIWAACCVRFTFTLKIVKLTDLGTFANAQKGVSKTAQGKIKCAGLDKVEDTSRTVVRGLQKDQNCIGLLVVDEVDGLAGFAWTLTRNGRTSGGRAGVVTIDKGGKYAAGMTTAHEIGHGLAAIEHVEGGRAHAHGELMWGKDCPGYPTRQRGVDYVKLPQADCAKMRGVTRATRDACAAAGAEEG